MHFGRAFTQQLRGLKMTPFENGFQSAKCIIQLFKSFSQICVIRVEKEYIIIFIINLSSAISYLPKNLATTNYFKIEIHNFSNLILF